MNIFCSILVYSFLCCFFPAVVHADDQVYKKVLENGLTVVIYPMPSSKVIAIDALVKTGSSLEGKYLGKGISHYVEHMLFKGTKRRAVGAIADEVKAMGGYINASTGLDATIYTLNVPQGSVAQGLDIISDMLMNSVFEAEQVEKERDVIHGEMRLYNDRPDRRLNVDVFQNVYLRHPYRYPTIGYLPLFDSITRDELFGYYKERYIPNNIILSIAGDVNVKDIMPKIEALFKNFKMEAFPSRMTDTEQPQISKRFFQEYYKTPFFHFSLAYPGVALSDPDLFALDVLSMALGDGEASRLYQEIFKKKALVKRISSSNFTPADRGVFEIEGIMDEDHLDKVVDNVGAIINRIKQQGLTDEELKKAKRQVYARLIYDNQKASNVAYRLATDEYYTGDIYFSEHYVQAVKKVTNNDIKRVASKYLNDASLNVTVIKPQVTEKVSKVKQDVSINHKIKKIVLDNGLTFLLVQDHSSKALTVIAVMRAGVNQEEEQLNGISQLFSQVWIKGNVNKTEEQLLKEAQLRGASFNAFAGRNSIGLIANALSEDMPFVINTLADTIQMPSLTQASINEEKEKMYVDINEEDDDIRQATAKKVMKLLFKKHPARLDLKGTKESLSRITRKDVLAYYNKFVKPNNMVIAVSGDFKQDDLLSILKKRFENLNKGGIVLKDVDEKPPQETQNAQLTMPKEQAMLTMCFQAPSLRSKERWVFEYLSTILGSGLGGRLFNSVRDKLGNAYTVGAYYTPMYDVGTFTLFVLTTNDKVDSVKEIFLSQLNDLALNQLSDDEFNRAKRYLKASFKMRLDTAGEVANTVAFDELYGLGFDFYKEHDNNIDGVRKEDVQEAVKKYLNSKQAAVVITYGSANK